MELLFWKGIHRIREKDRSSCDGSGQLKKEMANLPLKRVKTQVKIWGVPELGGYN